MRKISLLTIFGIAFGYLEAAVVVYLIKIYYPQGFSFSRKLIPVNFLIVEVLREFSTLLILLAVAVLAGSSFPEKVSYFLYSFGVWDIFYYIWLKVILNWPASFYPEISLSPFGILLIVLSGITFFVTFRWNFSRVVNRQLPGSYPWGVFLFGEILALIPVGLKKFWKTG